MDYYDFDLTEVHDHNTGQPMCEDEEIDNDVFYDHNTGQPMCEDEEIDDDVLINSDVEEENNSEDEEKNNSEYEEENNSEYEEEYNSEAEEVIIEETAKQKMTRNKYDMQTEDMSIRMEHIDIKKLEEIINSEKYEEKYSTEKIKQDESIASTMKRVLKNANEPQEYKKAAIITRHVAVFIVRDPQGLCLVKFGNKSWMTTIVSILTVVI